MVAAAQDRDALPRAVPQRRGPGGCGRRRRGDGFRPRLIAAASQLGLYLGVRHTVERITLEEPDDVLFTELHDTHDHWECPDAWPHSEAGRFHRGISLLLVALALLLLVAEGACHHGPKELALLALLAIGALAARWLARDFRAHPAGFPEPTPGHGLRMMATDADGQPLGSSSDPLGR